MGIYADCFNTEPTGLRMTQEQADVINLVRDIDHMLSMMSAVRESIYDNATLTAQDAIMLRNVRNKLTVIVENEE